MSTRVIALKLHGQELAISEPLPTSKLLDHAAVTKCNNDLLGLGLHPASEEAYSLLQAQSPTLKGWQYHYVRACLPRSRSADHQVIHAVAHSCFAQQVNRRKST